MIEVGRRSQSNPLTPIIPSFVHCHEHIVTSSVLDDAGCVYVRALRRRERCDVDGWLLGVPVKEIATRRVPDLHFIAGIVPRLSRDLAVGIEEMPLVAVVEERVIVDVAAGKRKDLAEVDAIGAEPRVV